MDYALKHQGYLVCTGKHRLMNVLRTHQWQYFLRFADQWNYLKVDPFLRDEGKYRQRRYSVFHWRSGKLCQLPHEPHFQKSQYNGLHGGFNRFFYPWHVTLNVEKLLSSIVFWVTSRISHNPNQQWRIQAHQFRIIATAGQVGKPTPEGVHKDGADFILIMLMNRKNIIGGVSQIYNNDQELVDEVCLSQEGDLLLIDDEKVFHGVTAVASSSPSGCAYRDVLVLTFHNLCKKQPTRCDAYHSRL